MVQGCYTFWNSLVSDNQMLRAVTGGIPTVHFGYKTSGIKGAELLLEQIEEKNPVPVHMKLGFQIVNRFE